MTDIRTIKDLVADIMRECRGQATPYEARQALQDAFNFIDASANWEFLLATQLININAPVTAGTVSCVAGTTSVTLTGSTWVASTVAGEFREIKFFQRDLPYKVTFVSSTHATLDTPLSGNTDIVNGVYVMYQAVYPLPSDCGAGRDLSLKGTVQVGYNGNLPKRQRLIYDRHSSNVFNLGIPMYYTDDEFNEFANRATIRIEPYPARSYEFRLTYYRTLPLSDGGFGTQFTVPQIMIPPSFIRAPILMAASNILRKKNVQGWQIMRQEAQDLLNKMYNRYASSPAYEGKINPQDYVGEMDDIFGFDSVMYTSGT